MVELASPCPRPEGALPGRCEIVLQFMVGFGAIAMISYRSWNSTAMSSRQIAKLGPQQSLRRILARNLVELALDVTMLAFAAGFSVLTIPGLPMWMRLSGGVLLVVARLLLLYSRWSLGKMWAPNASLNQSHKIVEKGPYKWIRHPIYFSFWPAAAGAGIATSSWLVAALGFITAIGYASAIKDEESLMREAFGNKYQRYMNRTGRFIPRLR